MIILILLLYILLSLLDAGIIGALIAFLCSRPNAVIPAKRLAVISLVAILIQDVLMFLFFAPLDLTITTNNFALADLMGTSDLSDILVPSFSLFDCMFYAIDVFVAVWLGRLLVRKHHERYHGETIS